MKTVFRFAIDFTIRLNKTNRALALIYAKITVDGIVKEISLKEQIIASDWDSASEKVKGKSVQTKALNNHIEDVRFRLKEQYRMLSEKHCIITAESIKDAYFGTHKTQTGGHKVIELLVYHSKIAPGNLEPGTLKNYVTTEEYIRRFIKFKFNKDDIYLRELDYEFMTELEYYIRNNPVKKHDPCLGNGVMKHLERFKKMVKWAKQLKWVAADPFEDYKLSLKRYKRVKLDIYELQRIENNHFENPILAYVKDLFLFSCYTGLAYADVMALKQIHFEHDNNGKAMLKIYREKSEELSSVPILNIAIYLVDKYKDHPKAKVAGTIFPYISNQDLNRNLKIIAELCGIKKYMSFHLARHTFATVITLKNGVPIETVSKMLGHRKISTTEIYAEVDDEKIMEDMSDVENRMKIRGAATPRL